MKNTKKSPVGYVALAFAIIVLLCLIALICLTEVEASAKTTEPTITSICTKVNEPDGEWWNDGHLYIIKKGVMQFGEVHYKGNTYYCHYTDSREYPRGSATVGEMRIRSGNRWYAYDGNGRLITKDYYIRKGKIKKRLSLKINRDGTVRYVYNTSACFGGRRYSTKERRYQELQRSGKWKTLPGMQFYPDYVDNQR